MSYIYENGHVYRNDCTSTSITTPRYDIPIDFLKTGLCWKTAIGDYDGDKDKILKENIKPDYIPRKILFNDPVSVVFWKDGTKTIVRRAKGEKFNKYTAFTAALAKKIFDNNTTVNKIVASGIDQKEKDELKKKRLAAKKTK